MSNTQPTEPLPPRQEPPVPPGAHGVPTHGAPSGAYGRGPIAATTEPFYKRHGLAFAISTLVLSIVVLLGLVTAGGFAVASVVARVGERVISHSVPHQPGMPGVPGMPGRPGDGGGGGGKSGPPQGGGTQKGQVVARGTIASLSGDTWTIDRPGGSSVEVTVDAQTAFGVPGQSASKSDFATGDEVIVIGTRSDGQLTATRILKLDAFPTRPPSTPGAPQTPGS
ncbi:DUF5666 domain-containing protein [Leifsonia sp. 2MCAF36]|uniref:DUF5666 domain-containing protein n=1 Tax=Leifsonia sp. 2MCAF36 TaxID=3232988 RepID=UPI003F9DF959